MSIAARAFERCRRCAPAPSARWTSAIVLLGAMAISANITVLSIVLPKLVDYFNESEANVAWVSLAPALTNSAFTTVAGAAADRFGRKRVWIWGFALNLLSLALCALSPTLAWLVLGRVLSGIGGALDTPSGFALMTGNYPPNERATPIGQLFLILNLGPSIGLVVGGIAVQFVSWRWLFWTPIPIGFVALALAPFVLQEVSAYDLLNSAKSPRGNGHAHGHASPVSQAETEREMAAADSPSPQPQLDSPSSGDADEDLAAIAESNGDGSGSAIQMRTLVPTSEPASDSELTDVPVSASVVVDSAAAESESAGSSGTSTARPHRKFDIKGGIICGIASATLVYAVNQAPELGADASVITSSVVCVATSLWFWWHLRTCPHPVIPVDMFRDPIINWSLFTRTILQLAYAGAFLLQPFFMTLILDSPLWEIAVVLVVRPMAVGLTSSFVGKAFKNPNMRTASIALLIGGLCIFFSVSVFVFASSNMSPVLIGFAVAVQGAGLGIWNPLSMTLLTARVPDEHLSAVSAVSSLAMSLGQTIGMAVFLAVCQLFGGTSSVSAYQAAFGAMGLCALVGVVATLRTCQLLLRNLPVVWKSESDPALELPSPTVVAHD